MSSFSSTAEFPNIPLIIFFLKTVRSIKGGKGIGAGCTPPCAPPFLADDLPHHYGCDRYPDRQYRFRCRSGSCLAWGHLARQVADPEASAANLDQAIVPVYGVSWNRTVITSQAVGGANEINRSPCLLRNSNLARLEYDRLAAFMLQSYSHSSLFPPEMGEWREIAQRYRAELHFPWINYWLPPFSWWRLAPPCPLT